MHSSFMKRGSDLPENILKLNVAGGWGEFLSLGHLHSYFGEISCLLPNKVNNVSKDVYI
jgi:hypothetical protein